MLPARAPRCLTRNFNSDTLQRDFLPVHVLHVVVQARMLCYLPVVAQGDILLLPVPVHHLVRLLEEVALPQWDAAPTAHLDKRLSYTDNALKACQTKTYKGRMANEIYA